MKNKKKVYVGLSVKVDKKIISIRELINLIKND